MLRLFFLRHGNTFEDGEASCQIGAKTDIPLTAQGRAQAEKAADFFASQDIALSAIHAGGLKRQRETAEIVAKKTGAPVLETDALSELDYGAWENLTTDEVKAKFPASYEAWSKAGEWPAEFAGSAEDARRRLSVFLERIRCSYEDGSAVLAVTSQGIMKLVTSVIEPERWTELQSRRAVDDLKVKTGAICEIALERDGWRTIAWNVVPE